MIIISIRIDDKNRIGDSNLSIGKGKVTDVALALAHLKVIERQLFNIILQNSETVDIVKK